MKHYLIAAVIVIVLAVTVSFALNRAPLLPVAASQQAGPIDALFHVHFTLIAILFSLIVGLMVYSIIAFRRRKGDTGDGDHIEGNTRLEIFWTLVPLAMVLYISYLGAMTLADINRADPKALEVNVIASQWAWRFEYPATGIVTNELVLPVNQQVLLHLHSLDVIHSFWVPEFRVKQDVLPGGPSMVRDLRVTPDLVGDYTVRCAEMCGKMHAYMESPVHVKSQADFDAWVAGQSAAASNDPTKRGETWAKQYGCVGCHSVDGTTKVGPSWKGLYGSQVELADGATVTADDAYITESIKVPGAKIAKDFSNIMPDLKVKDNQIADLIAYIKSLK
jgi:cytochrome c oxidase subunit II